MRAVPALLQSILDEGVFLGDSRNSARVTVEPDWWLNLQASGVGNWPYKKLPVRWFQDAANDQVEIELPNVRMIDIDESIDNAAAACTITVLNQKMRSNVTFDPKIPTEFGQPGYYTPTRGDSLEAQARWGQVPNDWNHVLVPNALLRTYEGFGGNDKPLAQAIADGNVMLTGLWLVDEVTVTTGAKLEIKCRDMMKLLIEQQLFPPLIPLSLYPLAYARWVYTNTALNAHGVDVGTVTKIAPGDRYAVLSDSSVDRWYPQGSPGSEIANGGFLLHGHKAADAFDGNTDTYWLGEGNSGADKPFAVSFLEADCGGEAMNAIYVHPWAGDYTMYISVMENGVWQGANIVPYDPSVLFGTQPYAVDTGAAIPYITAVGVPWETPQEYVLDRVYAAQKVRITFRHLTDSGIGPWLFRAGVREFRVRIGAGGAQVGTMQHIEPTFYSAVSILDPANPVPTGYLTGSQLGQIDAFGDARVFGVTGGDDPSNAAIEGIAFTKTRNGYWVVRTDGRVTCHGDAVFHGSPYHDGVPFNAGNHYADILPTFTGDGYWVTRWDGTIRSYGDAPTYAPVTVPAGEALSRSSANPTAYGLFLALTNGVVNVRGTAVTHGNFTGVALTWGSGGSGTVEFISDLQSTKTGLGYWMLTSAGRVQAHGDAVSYGQVDTPTPSGWDNERFYSLMPSPYGLGYLLMRGDGTIFPFGDVAFFGGPASGTAQLRSDGDYLDFADIIVDLLMWSGWFLKENLANNAPPSVFGQIESTGTYSNDPLPADLFDKHPVIDAINTIKEIVGYQVGCSYDGSFFFNSPNWWEAGNFDELGNHIDTIPEIDERVDLTQYGVQVSDRPLRSEILISSQKIDPNDFSAEYVRYVPSTAKLLRGMVKPAMWVDAHFLDENEMKLMAELIALRIWFAVRAGQLTAWINPAIQINDQIRVLERETSESYVHYVRARHTTNDMETGAYTMQIQTNWLGDRENWVITSEDLAAGEDLGRFQISFALQQRLAELGSFAQRLFGSQGSTHVLLPTQYNNPDNTDHGNKAGPP